MDGSATPTMVMSSSNMNAAVHTNTTVHLCRDEVSARSAICLTALIGGFRHDGTVQLGEHRGECHLAVAGLESAVEGGLRQSTRFGASNVSAKTIRVLPEVVNRCQRDCVHPVLDGG